MASLHPRSRAPADPVTDAPTRRRFTVEEYERMIGAGIVREGERVEMIDGEIVQMTAMNGRHAAAVRRLDRRWHVLGGLRILVSIQCPIRLPPGAMPEPDVALLRPRADFYEAGHPGPNDVLLLIEVSDTTIGFDRSVKLPMYARARIVEVWIVDLAARTVTVYRDPHRGRYRTSVTYLGTDTMAPLTLPDLFVSVSEIVGEPASG